MNALKEKTSRNQTLECLKLFAAVFIVYAHVVLPGQAGKLIDCLVRFTVPLFFAISGYFSYNVRSAKLIKRFWHIIKLNLISALAIVLCDCFFAAIQGNSVLDILRSYIPNTRQLINWVLLHVNPFEGHLWYLAAIAAAYMVLAVYTGFFGESEINYHPLYIVSAALFLIRFTATDMLNRLDFNIPFYFLRDGWFLGVPMLSLGLFLRQYQEQIYKNYALTSGKLFFLLLFGIVLSVMQYITLGSSELPLGAVVQVIALILLSVLHPTVDGGSVCIRRIVSSFGFLSTTVYILQFCVYDVYAYFFAAPISAFLGSLEIWFRPLLISLGGCAVGIVLLSLQKIGKRLLKKQSSS